MGHLEFYGRNLHNLCKTQFKVRLACRENYGKYGLHFLYTASSDRHPGNEWFSFSELLICFYFMTAMHTN